jgi:putative effector of murein hydrolase
VCQPPEELIARLMIASLGGFAAGLAAHGIGTARVFQVDEIVGVFSGIAMSLNALVTSLLMPLAVTLLR